MSRYSDDFEADDDGVMVSNPLFAAMLALRRDKLRRRRDDARNRELGLEERRVSVSERESGARIEDMAAKREADAAEHKRKLAADEARARSLKMRSSAMLPVIRNYLSRGNAPGPGMAQAMVLMESGQEVPEELLTMATGELSQQYGTIPAPDARARHAEGMAKQEASLAARAAQGALDHELRMTLAGLREMGQNKRAEMLTKRALRLAQLRADGSLDEIGYRAMLMEDLEGVRHWYAMARMGQKFENDKALANLSAGHKEKLRNAELTMRKKYGMGNSKSPWETLEKINSVLANIEKERIGLNNELFGMQKKIADTIQIGVVDHGGYSSKPPTPYTEKWTNIDLDKHPQVADHVRRIRDRLKVLDAAKAEFESWKLHDVPPSPEQMSIAGGDAFSPPSVGYAEQATGQDWTFTPMGGAVPSKYVKRGQPGPFTTDESDASEIPEDLLDVYGGEYESHGVKPGYVPPADTDKKAQELLSKMLAGLGGDVDEVRKGLQEQMGSTDEGVRLIAGRALRVLNTSGGYRAEIPDAPEPQPSAPPAAPAAAVAPVARAAADYMPPELQQGGKSTPGAPAFAERPAEAQDEVSVRLRNAGIRHGAGLNVNGMATQFLEDNGGSPAAAIDAVGRSWREKGLTESGAAAIIEEIRRRTRQRPDADPDIRRALGGGASGIGKRW
jgi:hypothetical protein